MNKTRNFNSSQHCALCGKPMLHSRLSGYRCMAQGHEEILAEIYDKANFDDVLIEDALQKKRIEMGYSDNG